MDRPAPLPGQRTDRDRHPRIPAPVRSWRSGAPLWSPPTSRGRSRPPTAERQAHRLHNAVEWGHEDVSGAGGPSQTSQAASLYPPRRRVRSLPAGIIRAAGAGWERPPTTEISTRISADSGAVDRTIGGGSLPAPLSAQKRRLRFGSLRPNRSGAIRFWSTVTSEG